MGGSSYSDDAYHTRSSTRSAKGLADFSHTADVRAGRTSTKLHDKMNPKGVVRESRDSDAHPNSNAIIVTFDVTGSMREVPGILLNKLPNLMQLLLTKGYVEDPQILMSAVGDEFNDSVPLQVGQFESGIEMADDMSNLFLEGGGGGTYEESYGLSLYFAAYKTSIDCYEKRNKKGYLFLIGDEKPWHINKESLVKIFGEAPQEVPTLEQVIAEAQKKYHIFFIIPNQTAHYHDVELSDRWKKLIGDQNVLKLEDPNAVCELIGSTIGLMEGTTDLDSVAITDGKTKGVVSTALSALAESTALARAGSGDLPEVAGRSTAGERL